MTDIQPNTDFENYNETSQTYDDLRHPIGLSNLRSAFEKVSLNLSIPVKDLKLLDVGCGTGNYINAIRAEIGQCDGLEYNQGMFKKSEDKFKEFANVTLVQGSALQLDHIPTGSYDIVIMTQVMHHLSPETHQ